MTIAWRKMEKYIKKKTESSGAFIFIHSVHFSLPKEAKFTIMRSQKSSARTWEAHFLSSKIGMTIRLC